MSSYIMHITDALVLGFLILFGCCSIVALILAAVALDKASDDQATINVRVINYVKQF